MVVMHDTHEGSASAVASTVTQQTGKDYKGCWLEDETGVGEE